MDSLSSEVKLLRQNNSSVPISSLSAEVFLHIISMTRRSDLEFDADTADNFRHCSQVCHTWRVRLLSDPLLWSSCISWLDFRQGVEWTNELLRRSGSKVPLTVGICLHWKEEHPDLPMVRRRVKSGKTEAINLLSQRLQQIKNLKFYFDGSMCELEDFQDSLGSFFGGTASSLVSFDMGSLNVGNKPQRQECFIWIQNTGVVFPKLKNLHTRNCLIDVGSPIYSQLTTLKVSDIACGADLTPTAVEWLRVIKTCQSLVSWSFEGFIPPSPADYRPSTKKSILPSLAHLQLHLSSADAIIIFSSLEFPDLRTFDVIIDNVLPTEANFPVLTNIMQHHIDSFLFKLESSSWHVSFVDGGIRYMKDQTDLSGRTTFSIQYTMLELWGAWECMPQTTISLTRALLPHGINTTEHLSLSIIHPSLYSILPAKASLVAVLCAFTSVTTLRVACYHSADGMVFSARVSKLTAQRPILKVEEYNELTTSESESSLFALLPRLSHLYVPHITPLDPLRAIIVKRSRFGLPIKTIQFSDPLFHYQRDQELSSRKEKEQLSKLGPIIIIDDDIPKPTKYQ
ncbi:hypothetical protein BDN70DRAFT_415496 [Pholiota conissans]|uniref:F-box domain-containing protein n=1 Tax=Pholiota conissans TaxID=109636 RepID=A0A9P6CUW9_9AGAR|nr:hypothetical protein BDN70DRAFT_415496 [Pholiota conissans]